MKDVQYATEMFTRSVKVESRNVRQMLCASANRDVGETLGLARRDWPEADAGRTVRMVSHCVTHCTWLSPRCSLDASLSTTIILFITLHVPRLIHIRP